MLVQCTSRKLHALKSPVILLKLDISKAFDIVVWAFFIEVLHKMGFSPRIIGWICGLLSTASSRVLINGIRGTSLFHARRLRQGDPSSPFLFNLVMEIIHHLFRRAAELGILTPLAGSGLKQRVSLFADDAMIFINPLRHRCLIYLVMCFK